MSDPTRKELFELLDELSQQYKIVDELKEENKKLIVTNSNLVKKIEELKEYEAMYKDLCR